MLIIFSWIVTLSIILSFVLYLHKKYKSLKTIDGKSIFFLMLFIFVVPLIIYYFDRYNIFSKLHWIQNMDSDKWFNFIAMYVSSIIGASIGAVVLIIMTIHEMNNQDEKDKEFARINNIPLLTYKLIKNKGEIDSKHFFETNCKDGKSIDFELTIKNVGMNAIKKSFIAFSSNDFSETYYSWLDNNGCIDKNENVTIYRFLNLSFGKHKINFTIYYCDLINNWYSQNGELNFDVTDIYDNDGIVYTLNLIVEDEKLLKEEPKRIRKRIQNQNKVE